MMFFYSTRTRKAMWLSLDADLIQLSYFSFIICLRAASPQARASLLIQPSLLIIPLKESWLFSPHLSYHWGPLLTSLPSEPLLPSVSEQPLTLNTRNILKWLVTEFPPYPPNRRTRNETALKRSNLASCPFSQTRSSNMTRRTQGDH